MPRAKKTNIGAPAQKIEPIKGQTYGDGVRQESLQKAMPAPNMQAMQAPAVATAAPTAPQQPTPRMSEQDMMNKIRSVGGILSAPDDRPDLPITDGLSTGPGRGPEALTQIPNRTGQFFRQLSVQTGDPIFAELARKAGF